MTGIVLLAGVFVLFVVTESYYKSRTIDAMEAAINAIEIRDTEEGKLDVTIIQNGFAKMYTGNIMVIVTDREGNIEFASSSVKVEDASVITRAVRYVAGTDERNRQGKIPSQNLRYLRSVKGDYNCIALVDLTE
ncbi:MAG TPA: hypothetical protein PLS28_06215, partial [Clostridiales bacterium]|nr:hypothetical protein [Clostridiales bacterium]